jgi:Family of unknown function (DUF6114)
LEERPLTAFILSLLGSMFVIVGTVLGFVLYSASPFVQITDLTAILASISVALGLLMLTMTTLLYLRPGLHVAWGVTILVFASASITSVFSGYGGFGLGVVGMVLGIVGGAIAIAWHPGMGMAARSGAYRVCQSCGRMAPFGYAFCPFCGAPAPAVNPPTPGPPPPR